MRIKQVVDADFRKSDASIFLEFVHGGKNASMVSALGAHDVIVFVSKKGNQLLFVHGFEQLQKTIGGPSIRMLPSVKYRLINGTWSPYMLKNYAEMAGVPLEGLKYFEEYFGYTHKGE